VILFLALVNAIFVPIDICFKLEALNDSRYIFFDNLIDLIFLIDMILMAITSFTSRDG
jgi:hypothetical protein